MRQILAGIRNTVILNGWIIGLVAYRWLVYYGTRRACRMWKELAQFVSRLIVTAGCFYVRDATCKVIVEWTKTQEENYNRSRIVDALMQANVATSDYLGSSSALMPWASISSVVSGSQIVHISRLQPISAHQRSFSRRATVSSSSSCCCCYRLHLPDCGHDGPSYDKTSASTWLWSRPQGK